MLITFLKLRVFIDCFVLIRKLVVYIWGHTLSEDGGVVQGSCGLPASDAQTWNSIYWAENFQLLPGHIAPISENVACCKNEKEKIYIISIWKSLLTNVLLLQVSERAGHIIEYDKFYIHELDDLVDIRNDYITWFQRQMFPSVSPSVIISYLHLFFTLVFTAKYFALWEIG